MQGLIARRPQGTRVAVMMFKFGATEGARKFLRGCLPLVPNARAVASSSPPSLSLSLTWRGISLLVEGKPDLASDEGRSQLEPFFCEPIPTSPEALGFVGPSAPGNWWNGIWSGTDIDLIVHGAFADADQTSAEIGRLAAVARTCDLTLLEVPGFPEGVMAGYLPPGGILHFGFRDGISEPDIDWEQDESGEVDLREILLGYPNNDYPTAPKADGPWKDFVRDGTIACIAWIEQHVAEFERFLDEESAKLRGFAPPGQEREWLAARLLGRWRDGSPAVIWPDAQSQTPNPTNAFDYASDPDGVRCPLTSHIRVVNLRSDKMSFPNRIRFPNGPPRFIRRGFSYGAPYTGIDDGAGRGIVGTFLCARLNEQFNTVLRWMNATNFSDRFDHAPYAPTMQDAMFGARRSAGKNAFAVLTNADGMQRTVKLRDFITYRGVTHALMLSLPSLQRLAT